MEFWYRRTKSWQAILLLPFAWIFQGIVLLRQFCYRHKFVPSTSFPVPVIIVGNITVGGTGKTPLIIGLVHLLKSQGWRPGLVSRGYGGAKQKKPLMVTLETTPPQAGDEACLMAKRGECPVVVAVDRVAAVEYLLKHTDCNIVLSDDGLQHYRLSRDIEIAVIDADRQFGNGCYLPAGPLRESLSRLKKVDFIIQQGEPKPGVFTMQLVGNVLVSIKNSSSQKALSDFNHKMIHAVAGIGNPARFFASLRKKGFEVIEHVFPDHYLYCAKDFEFSDKLPIIMTEKDAVKCHSFVDERFWYLPVEAQWDKDFEVAFISKLKRVMLAYSTK